MANKSGANSGRFKKGERDPRQGRGPKPGALNAGRPPDWFRAKMGELVTRDAVVSYLAQCLLDPDTPETFFKALDRALDRWMGKPTQRQELTGADGGPVETNIAVDSPRERLVGELARIARRQAAGETPGDGQ